MGCPAGRPRCAPRWRWRLPRAACRLPAAAEEESSGEEEEEEESESEEEPAPAPAKKQQQQPKQPAGAKRPAQQPPAQTPQPAKKAKPAAQQAPATAPAKVAPAGMATPGNTKEYVAALKAALQAAGGPLKLAQVGWGAGGALGEGWGAQHSRQAYCPACTTASPADARLPRALLAPLPPSPAPPQLGTKVKRPAAAPKIKHVIEQHASVFKYHKDTDQVTLA